MAEYNCLEDLSTRSIRVCLEVLSNLVNSYYHRLEISYEEFQVIFRKEVQIGIESAIYDRIDKLQIQDATPLDWYKMFMLHVVNI
jgi:hypothetical protein